MTTIERAFQNIRELLNTCEIHLFRSDNLWFDSSDCIKKTIYIRTSPSNGAPPPRFWTYFRR